MSSMFYLADLCSVAIAIRVAIRKQIGITFWRWRVHLRKSSCIAGPSVLAQSFEKGLITRSHEELEA